LQETFTKFYFPKDWETKVHLTGTSFEQAPEIITKLLENKQGDAAVRFLEPLQYKETLLAENAQGWADSMIAHDQIDKIQYLKHGITADYIDSKLENCTDDTLEHLLGVVDIKTVNADKVTEWTNSTLQKKMIGAASKAITAISWQVERRKNAGLPHGVTILNAALNQNLNDKLQQRIIDAWFHGTGNVEKSWFETHHFTELAQTYPRLAAQMIHKMKDVDSKCTDNNFMKDMLQYGYQVVNACLKHRDTTLRLEEPADKYVKAASGSWDNTDTLDIYAWKALRNPGTSQQYLSTLVAHCIQNNVTSVYWDGGITQEKPFQLLLNKPMFVVGLRSRSDWCQNNVSQFLINSGITTTDIPKDIKDPYTRSQMLGWPMDFASTPDTLHEHLTHALQSQVKKFDWDLYDVAMTAEQRAYLRGHNWWTPARAYQQTSSVQPRSLYFCNRGVQAGTAWYVKSRDDEIAIAIELANGVAVESTDSTLWGKQAVDKKWVQTLQSTSPKEKNSL
jgi:hypothetical protein